MAKLGRPAGIDSAETRQRIIDAARQAFASYGFAATAITTLAKGAGLAPSAVYHYFGGKAELYEAVFDATAEAIWEDIGGATRSHDTLRKNMVAMLQGSTGLSEEHPGHNNFLALVPMEARLHPEFAHLMDRRSKYQDETFGDLADLGIANGELPGFSRNEAVEMLRSLIMGWFFERHFRPDHPMDGTPILVTIDAIARSKP